MERIFKDEWVSRLRSGKIKKSQDYLAGHDGSHCAVGVLCEIMAEKGLITKNRYGGHIAYDNKWVSIPPPAVTQMIGMSPMQIIHMNSKQSFKKIADWIEENL